MASVEEILQKLKAKARPDRLDGMARFAIVRKGRLGVPVPEMWELGSDAVQQRFGDVP
jgi:hypothetical protein